MENKLHLMDPNPLHNIGFQRCQEAFALNTRMHAQTYTHKLLWAWNPVSLAPQQIQPELYTYAL